MKLTFHGAAGEVTGSCNLIETAKAKFLVDLGLFQGGEFAEKRNYETLPFNAAKIDAVFVTHSHLDHIGRLPLLTKNTSFKGKIYMLEPSYEMAHLILNDAAKIIGNEARYRRHAPLYTKKDVRALLERVVKVKYHQRVKVVDGEAVFYDAGHILGSAFIEVKTEGKSVVFSGDLGNPPSLFHKFTEKIPPADYVVIETTYGDRIHEDSRLRLTKLERAIENIIRNRGTLLIPTFAIDRTQELLYSIDELVREKASLCIPIFLDSPLAIKVTSVYEKFGTYYNTEARRFIAGGEQIFNFPCLRDVLRAGDSLAIDNVPPPKIIIAGNGMMHGGRILNHAKLYLSDPKSELLFVGYQAKGSLGRKLFDGAREVAIDGKKIKVRALIKAIGAFSGHADRTALLYWIKGAPKIKKIFLTHGESKVRASFKSFLEGVLDSEIIAPAENQSYLI